MPGFEGFYKVSEFGNVYSVPRKGYQNRMIGGRSVTPKRNNRGYWQIRLYKDGITFNFLLHRLVAMAFTPNPDNLPQVNHKDENKDNNTPRNLEWCTNIYNRHYGTGYKRSVENHDYFAINARSRVPVKQITSGGELVAIWESQAEASRKTGINNSGISACCLGKCKQAGGYSWEYA